MNQDELKRQAAEKALEFLPDSGERNPVYCGGLEHKMGIRGSSTCSVILQDARIPEANLLGERGRGHVIAFNILKILGGGTVIGPILVGAARSVMRVP